MNMMNPKIGIIVPVYKVKKQYLDECVLSLTKQTYNNIQIILIDDCTPDEGGKWCEEYANNDNRISVYHHEHNMGLPSARNTGINRLDSDCDWAMFVDSDDWLDLDCCEKLVLYLLKWDKEPDMIVFTGYRNYPESEERSNPIFDNETWFVGKEQIESLQQCSMKFCQKCYPSATLNIDSACWKLCSTKLFKEKNLRFINVPYREDGLFFLYSTQISNSVVYIYEPMYHYRSTENSMVNMYRPKADEEHLLYFREVWKFIDLFKKNDSFVSSVYYAVLLSMQICIVQDFFNRENKNSLFKKHKSCREYFKKEPYRKVFKNIKISTLRRNHFIKALFIRFHLYSLLLSTRNLYKKVNRKNDYS